MLTATKLPGFAASSQVDNFIVTGKGTQPTVFIYSPTMRYRRIDPDVIPNNTTREAEDTFAVGFVERLRFFTSDSFAWYWRRCCISFTDISVWVTPEFGVADSTFTSLPANNGESELNGYRRVWSQIEPTIPAGPQTPYMDAVRNQLYRKIFQGTFGQDWTNSFTAPLDSSAVKVWYDRTKRITSGNDAAVNLFTKRWHPIRKTLIYANRESGKDEGTLNYSETTTRSMGDYYILDMFMCTQDDTNVQLGVGSDARYYWHER